MHTQHKRVVKRLDMRRGRGSTSLALFYTIARKLWVFDSSPSAAAAFQLRQSSRVIGGEEATNAEDKATDTQTKRND